MTGTRLRPTKRSRTTSACPVTDVPGASRLLLDTHVLLWWLRGSADLSDDVKERIDTELEVYVSSVSVWELSIKKASGKLRLPDDLVEWIERGGLSDLPVRLRHADLAGRLPLIHRYDVPVIKA